MKKDIIVLTQLLNALLMQDGSLKKDPLPDLKRINPTLVTIEQLFTIITRFQ